MIAGVFSVSEVVSYCSVICWNMWRCITIYPIRTSHCYNLKNGPLWKIATASTALSSVHVKGFLWWPWCGLWYGQCDMTPGAVWYVLLISWPHDFVIRKWIRNKSRDRIVSSNWNLFWNFFWPEEGESIKSKIWKNKMIKRVPTKLQNDFQEWITLDMSDLKM